MKQFEKCSILRETNSYYSDSSIFNKEDIKALEWKDIHGKNLKIFVRDDENGICAYGIDEDANIYVLYNEVKREE